MYNHISSYNGCSTITPSSRNSKAGWLDTHENHVALAIQSLASLVIIGDSIVAGLTRYAKVWNTYFSPLKTLNFGVRGDRTQNVMWRAENLVLPLTVRFAVIHCGTNNLDNGTASDIANGILSVGIALQKKKK